MSGGGTLSVIYGKILYLLIKFDFKQYISSKFCLSYIGNNFITWKLPFVNHKNSDSHQGANRNSEQSATDKSN